MQVGQQLWWVPAHRHNGDPRHVTITKVARKWVTLDNGYRIDKDRMVADGGQYSSPGRCYYSKALHEEERERIELWHQLYLLVNRAGRAPSHVSNSDIRSAIARFFPKVAEAS
jgi:hypothetical protein